jgi:hypothetical protein
MLLLGFGSLNSEIIKITNIQDIRQEISADTLVLFNIAEVLMDTETSLGTGKRVVWTLPPFSCSTI